MSLFSRRPKDWRIVQQARSEFVISALRDRLPASTLWHEKRFTTAQLESLCLVSTRGVYHINTYDAAAPGFTPPENFPVVDDLAICVRHDSRSHNGLDARELNQLILAASSNFNSVLENARDAISGQYRRVTCVVEFKSPTEDVEHSGSELLELIARSVGWSLSYVPFNSKHIWLPTSDFYNAKPLPEYGRAAGEFVFEKPLAATAVTHQIQSLLKSTGDAQPPGIHGTIPDVRYLEDVHMIARRF